tara:strand:+ start:18672 stop:19565 length:894 start_codon:yes stop_codon:yes gene_type:complete
LIKKDTYIGFPNRSLIVRNFDRSANLFNNSDIVHSEIRDRLIDKLKFFNLDPKMILDLGSATGKCSLKLNKLFPTSKVISMDNSLEMNRVASKNCFKNSNVTILSGDAEMIPLMNSSVDLVFSNLLLPWCDTGIIFSEVSRILKNDGLFIFSSVGPDTLSELRKAWATVDSLVHVHGFLDMHDLGDMLIKANLLDPVLDINRLSITYNNLASLISDIRSCGASNIAQGRRTSLTGKEKWNAFCRNIELENNGSGFNVTIEAIFGHAWHSKKTASNEPSSKLISLEGIRNYEARNKKK